MDICAKKMLCQDAEEKWGKTKKVEAWDSDGLSRGICACETPEALVSLDLVHTICAQQQLFVLIFIILFMLNMVAEANIYKSSHHSEGGIWSLLTMPFDTEFYLLANL